MGELERMFQEHDGRLVSKWRHYLDVYERHFQEFRGKPVRVLEFGVWHGGSLQLWRRYFGPQAQIVGVDLNPACAAFAGPGTEIVIGDQADPATHNRLCERFGTFDIVIDDGGHQMGQQITTFREIYPAVSPGGVYVVEDVHSSYLAHWGGGLRQPGTFVEFTKLLVDQLHAWYGPPPGMEVDYMTQTAYGLHFYDSMFVVEKRRIAPPRSVFAGTPALPLNASELQFLARMDLDAGRKGPALERFREALRAAPHDARLLEQIRTLEAEAP